MPGMGMPAGLYLEEFGRIVADAFDATPYHVGSSVPGHERAGQYRDVDVRVLLDDDVYAAMGFGDPERPHLSAKWVALVMAFSELGRRMTGLPIDFQIQQVSYANEKFATGRSALGVRSEYRRAAVSPDTRSADNG